MKSVYCNSNAYYHTTNFKPNTHVNKNNKLLNEHYNDPKYKTELCDKFTRFGKCSYKGKCRYAHGEKELLSRSILNKNYRKSNCEKFSNGFCPYGMRCLYNHKYNSLNIGYSFLLDLKKNSFNLLYFSKRLKCFNVLDYNENNNVNVNNFVSLNLNSSNKQKNDEDLNILSQNTSSTNLDSRKISQNSFIAKDSYLFEDSKVN